MCRYRHHFFSFITVIDYYQCDLIITHTVCLINNYNTNTNTMLFIIYYMQFIDMKSLHEHIQ